MSVLRWSRLDIDLAGIDLSAPQISILADHDTTLKGIVGHGRTEVRSGKLIVSGTLTPPIYFDFTAWLCLFFSHQSSAFWEQSAKYFSLSPFAPS